MNAILGRLRRTGFTPNLTHHAYHALDSHIVGFVLWVLPYTAISREQPDLAADFLKDFPADELPYLAEHIREHAEDRPGDTSEFEFGLDILLDGLERLREGSAPQEPRRLSAIMQPATSSSPGAAVDLVGKAHTTVDDGRLDRPLLAIRTDAFLHLEGKLTRGREDEHADRAPAPLVAFSFCRMGSTNAAVLPVPDWAPASTSRPAST